MKPIVYSIYSPELPVYGVDFPDDLYNFWVIMHVDVGADHDSGVASFTFYATTRKYLNASSFDGSDLLRSTVVVECFSWDGIEIVVKNICDGAEASDWAGVCEKLLNRFEAY